MGGFSVMVRLSEDAAASQGIAASPNPKPDRTYAEPYPASEYRILAACKIWGVFHYFFAYRDLMDEDWDELLPMFLPRLIAAKDAKEYNLTIAEMLTHLADSNVRVESGTLTDYFGKAALGLRLRLIEKHAVITDIFDPEVRKAGVKEGDVVKTVDGETLVDRFKRQAQSVSASTTQSLGYTIISKILNGAEGSTAELSVEDRAGNRKQISLKRSTEYLNAFKAQRSGDALKLLPGNVGYVDLERLQTEEIPQLMDKFRDTKGIVFDMRGQPASSAARDIAAHLSGEQQPAAAIVTGPLTLSPDLQQADKASRSSSYFFVQTVPRLEEWKYKGKAIALIDERTSGAAEQDGLYLEAATKIEFIGMPSAGADSEITNFTVPGGITIYFSGRDIRHASGGKLQRLGIQPAVTAAPTLTGIRAGKDEVLEKALEQISPKLPPARVPSERVLRSSMR
jgi:C-terminal processing protease CtpA/Prc